MRLCITGEKQYIDNQTVEIITVIKNVVIKNRVNVDRREHLQDLMRRIRATLKIIQNAVYYRGCHGKILNKQRF